jgi:hypothetical protein
MEHKDLFPVIMLYIVFSVACGFKNVTFILFSTFTLFIISILSTSLIIYITDKIINYVRI